MDRNMFITYDNIIQSVDYGFIQYMIDYMDWKKCGLKFEYIIRRMTKNEILLFINNRNVEDLFSFLTDNRLNKDNVYTIGIDINQKDSKYFNDYKISRFGERLPILLANKSIDNLTISVDTSNINKVKILLELFDEYKDIVKIVDNSHDTIINCIKDENINSIFSDESILYETKDFLAGKSVMIRDVGWIYDIIDTNFLSKNTIAKITKNNWELMDNLDISFIDPFVYGKPREIKII